MTAHSDKFPWPSYYGHFDFFESRMREHSKVASHKKLKDGLYAINLYSGKTLKVFICECYSFGGAEYEELVQNYGPIDAAIISSNWCSYDFGTKKYLQGLEVGLFDIRGFMASLSLQHPWEYMSPEEKERESKK